MTDLHHLRPPRVPNPHPEFCLLAAASHFEQGHYQAGLTAITDCIWAMHEANYDPMDDRRLTELLRRIAGTEWTPGEAA